MSYVTNKRRFGNKPYPGYTAQLHVMTKKANYMVIKTEQTPTSQNPFEVSMLYAIICSQLHNRERMRTRYTDIGPLPPPEEGTFSSADEEFFKSPEPDNHRTSG